MRRLGPVGVTVNRRFLPATSSSLLRTNNDGNDNETSVAKAKRDGDKQEKQRVVWRNGSKSEIAVEIALRFTFYL